MSRPFQWVFAGAIIAALPILAVACGGDDDDAEDNTPAAQSTAATVAVSPSSAASASPTTKPSGSITVYAGRTEALIKPLVDQFQAATGITVNAKYGDTTQLAALLVEEGSASPADVYIAQDAGALGAVSEAGMLEALPASMLELVNDTYKAENSHWVGLSARARVIAYNADLVAQADLPDSYKDLTDPQWKGQVGWAPTNASFQSFVTAIRQVDGEAAAEKWLKDMAANEPKVFTGNSQVLQAINSGEIKVGLVNHYYLYSLIKTEGNGVKARNLFTANGDAGSLVNVAGAGILKTSKNKPAATAFVEFMLSEEAQTYFVETTYEYPVVTGMDADSRLTPLDELNPPKLDLSKLEDLQGTLALLRSTGVLQ